MKKWLLLSVALYAGCSWAQTVREGRVTYRVETVRMPPGSDGMKAQLPREMVLTFNEQFDRSDSRQYSAQTTLINDRKNGEFINLIEFQGNRYAVVGRQASPSSDAPNPVKVTPIEETKTILDYTCKKARVTFIKDQDTTLVELYYTPDILGANNQYPGLQGLMLEYETHTNGVIMRYTATKIETDKVKTQVFEIPKGYKKVTNEEFYEEVMRGRE